MYFTKFIEFVANEEHFEHTKEVLRNRKLKDKQYNDNNEQNKKTYNGQQNKAQKTTNSVIGTPQKWRMNPSCPLENEPLLVLWRMNPSCPLEDEPLLSSGE